MIENIYNFMQEKMGVFGTNVIIICISSLILILLLYLISVVIDKKRKDMSDKEEEFADRHSTINTIIALLIVLILASMGIWILKALFGWIASGIHWIIVAGSKLDAVVMVALITGFGSIVTVIVSSIVSKILDYRKRKAEYLAQKREKPYENFLVIYYKIHDNINNPGSYPQEEMIKDINDFSKGITMWGSKKVVNKWVEFRQIAGSGEGQWR